MWPLDIIPAELRKRQFKSMRSSPECDITCDTRNGRLTFGSHDRVIAQRLYSQRQWSWSLMNSCLRLLAGQGVLDAKENDTLVNVGANIGAVLTPLMRMGNFRNGLGFEPSPSNFKYLQQNVNQNGLADSVKVFPIGLSDQATMADFELSPLNCGDNRVRSAKACDEPSLYQEADRDTISVSLKPLDSVLAEADITLTERSLIWVDIQGHEGQFFLGAQNTLKSGVHVVSEFWPYGIHRSGIGKDHYFEITESLFSGFFRLQMGRWKYHPIHQIRSLFERFDKRGTKKSTDIVLINAQSSAIPAMRAA